VPAAQIDGACASLGRAAKNGRTRKIFAFEQSCGGISYVATVNAKSIHCLRGKKMLGGGMVQTSTTSLFALGNFYTTKKQIPALQTAKRDKNKALFTKMLSDARGAVLKFGSIILVLLGREQNYAGIEVGSRLSHALMEYPWLSAFQYTAITFLSLSTLLSVLIIIGTHIQRGRYFKFIDLEIELAGDTEEEYRRNRAAHPDAEKISALHEQPHWMNAPRTSNYRTVTLILGALSLSVVGTVMVLVAQN
jgi:hypothetical protein